MIPLLKDGSCYTITPDRDVEFQHHKEVAKELKVEFYLLELHQLWQRGTNENMNGLLREYFPKKYDVTNRRDSIQKR